MNRIKYLLGTAFICGMLVSCNQQKTPSSIAADFVSRLYSLDFEQATSLATADAKPLLEQSRVAIEKRVNLDEERNRRMSAPAETAFATADFMERKNGEDIIVQNNLISLTLHKEGNDWKVAAAADVVDALVNHPLYLEQAKTAWTNLQTEYDKRTSLVKDYVTMRINGGDKSAGIMAMDAAVRNCDRAKAGTAAERADYLSKQEKLEALLDKGISPAMNASSDLSLNFIVQLSDAKKHLQELRSQYSAAAGRARDKEYPSAP
jgi:hypothetical protein